MKIIGISGRKQSGKNTVANILHGVVLKENGLVLDFNIGPSGELLVLTTNANNEEGWGELDITRKDSDFLQYAEYNMWPYIKLYSFADTLKWLCTDLFDIPYECIWGSNERRNEKQEHLHWEKMPGHITTHHGYGAMTAREFMQFLGTDICRKIDTDIWMRNTLNRIKSEKSKLAVIADVRFVNEVKGVEDAGGTVVRLQRAAVDQDSHSSEVALDDYPFTKYIDNREQTLDDLMVKVKEFYNSLTK